jgi:hypothetical protein
MSTAWGWYHTQLWLYGHWLPGDSRGFRNRDHRIHSSGDYKHRPPAGEHAALHAHARSLLKQQPILLTHAQRELVGQFIVRWFGLKDILLAAASVGAAHSHLLCMLPLGAEDMTIGKAKRYASVESRRCDVAIPSQLFAAKGEPKRVADWAHFQECFEYITVKHAREGAWVWGADPGDLQQLWQE